MDENEDRTYTETSIRVITFSGVKHDWQPWEERELARAGRRGYKDVLLGRETVPPVRKDEEGNVIPFTDEQKAILKRNDKAYEELILSMDTSKRAGKVAFGIVKGTKTPEYPNGNAQLAWARLKKKYKPDTVTHLLDIQRQYQSATMRKGDDPDSFITYMEEMRTRMVGWNDITDRQFNIQVINNLTKDYERQVETIEKELGNANYGIENIRE